MTGDFGEAAIGAPSVTGGPSVTAGAGRGSCPSTVPAPTPIHTDVHPSTKRRIAESSRRRRRLTPPRIRLIDPSARPVRPILRPVLRLPFGSPRYRLHNRNSLSSEEIDMRRAWVRIALVLTIGFIAWTAASAWWIIGHGTITEAACL